MSDSIPRTCPFVDELLKALCRADAPVLSGLFGQASAQRLIDLYADLSVHQQQMFIVLLPSAVFREVRRYNGRPNARAQIVSAIRTTLIHARATDYDSIVVNKISGTMDGAAPTITYESRS
jgi:hypothetical protein